MNTAHAISAPARDAAPAGADSRGHSLSSAAQPLSLALVFGWIGAMKFSTYEAEAIQGLVASSPLTSWLYSALSIEAAAAMIGLVELAIAALLVAGLWHRHAALAGAAGAAITLLLTLSFLFTAPGWEASLGGFPALSVVPGQFLLKDAVLLAVATKLFAEARATQP